MALPARRYPLEGINLKDPLLFEQGMPHALFRQLRYEAPVYWNEEPEEDEPGFWALTKYDDIVAVSKNPQLFSPAMGGHQISNPPGLEANRAPAAFAELFAYGQALAERRRREPAGDLMSLMANVEMDGQRIDQQLLDGFFLLLVIAGNETTRNTISGGLLALIEHPDQYQLLREQPALIPTAVEEMPRWLTPVIHFRRTATADTELRGQTIRRGHKVVIWYPSANRDEDVFERPDVFDVRRKPNEHLAFGEGQHFCLGACLARLELRVMFEELLRRQPRIELAERPRRIRSYFLSGFTSMPVRFAPEQP